jgi:predicted transcriptional regulator
MARDRSKVVLTRLELEVMRAVWGAEPGTELTVREVVARLHGGERSGKRRALAYNTVQTVLNILRDKNVVRARPGDGRAHVYQPRVTREQVTTSMVGELVERLFDGDVQPLLVNLVGREEFSRAELEKLRSLIDERLDDSPRDPPRDDGRGDGEATP